MSYYRYSNGIEYLVTSKSSQAQRIYRHLLGRKCDVTIKHTRTRSLIKIYH